MLSMIRRKSDACSLALVLLAMAWMASGWVIAYAQAPLDPFDAVATVQIVNLTQRMDRTDADNVRRFDKLESMMQYILSGMFLNLGAHGITLARARQGRSGKSPIVLPGQRQE